MIMAFSIRRWGVGELVGAWATYWVALAGIKLGPFIRIVWDLSRLPANKGSVSLSAGNTGVVLTAAREGIAVWTGVAPASEVALWVAGPPLALWLAWLALRPSRREAAALRASAYDGLPDPARRGWQQPASPTATPLRAERRDERGS
jgi:hypothetical protein